MRFMEAWIDGPAFFAVGVRGESIRRVKVFLCVAGVNALEGERLALTIGLHERGDETIHNKVRTLAASTSRTTAAWDAVIQQGLDQQARGG